MNGPLVRATWFMFNLFSRHYPNWTGQAENFRLEMRPSQGSTNLLVHLIVLDYCQSLEPCSSSPSRRETPHPPGLTLQTAYNKYDEQFWIWNPNRHRKVSNIQEFCPIMSLGSNFEKTSPSLCCDITLHRAVQFYLSS